MFWIQAFWLLQYNVTKAAGYDTCIYIVQSSFATAIPYAQCNMTWAVHDMTADAQQHKSKLGKTQAQMQAHSPQDA